MDSGLQRKDIFWTFHRVIWHSFFFDHCLVDFKETTIAKDKNASWPKFISTSPSFTSSTVPQKVSFARIPTSIWLKYSSFFSRKISALAKKQRHLSGQSRIQAERTGFFELQNFRSAFTVRWYFTLWHHLYDKVQEKLRFLFTMRELCICYRVFLFFCEMKFRFLNGIPSLRTQQ